jgi:hypothetical protein
MDEPTREEVACWICGSECQKHDDCPFDESTASCRKAGKAADRVLDHLKPIREAAVKAAVEAERKQIGELITEATTLENDAKVVFRLYYMAHTLKEGKKIESLKSGKSVSKD